MKISWVRSESDKNSFKIFKNLGLDVFEVDKPDDTDRKIAELVKDDYSTIVLSNELAFFSEDIIKKYSNHPDVSVIITPPKRKK